MAANHSKNDRKTVEDFGLKRISASFEPIDVSFGRRFFNPNASDWQANSILVPETGRSMDRWHRLNSYALSLSQQAYIIFDVKTTSEEKIGSRRLTDMRAREMFIDNMRAASGGSDEALKTVKWLGGDMIISAVATKSIEDAFLRAGTTIGKTDAVVEVTPADGPGFAACFENNPLTSVVRSVLRNHAKEMGNAFIKRFIFITHGSDPFGDPILSIIAELGRPPVPS